MRKTKHTPGPWAIGKNHDAESEDFIIRQGDDPDSPAIASAFVDHIGLTEEESMANARLIAAAPELLAALERLVSACEKGDPETIAENVVFAKRNIRKAKGE